MSLITNVQNFALRSATESKALRTLLNGNAADLSALVTSNKTSAVNAINELSGRIDAAVAASGAVIDDAATASTTKTYSITRIRDLNAALKAEILGPNTQAALDTIKELADALGNDQNFASTVTTGLGNRVRTDTASQGLTMTQQMNARTNIGAVSATDVGDTTTNFVTTFENGLL